MSFLPGGSRRLRLLVLAVAERCDQRCVHCTIWRGAGAARPLTPAERLRVVDEALAAGVSEALLTGGEPLLSPDLLPVAERLKAGGARVLLATNGMLLGRLANELSRLVDEVYVSLDGARPVTHDALRGVAAFDRLAHGIAALRAAAPRVLRVARSTLHAGNLAEFEAIVDAARGLGLHHVSFLPLDARSAAFGGDPAARLALVPSAAAVDAFEVTVGRLAASGALADGFVLESPSKLRRLARHLRASGGAAAFERPACDAPWWSSVVEADGAVRPCFFQPATGDVRDGLRTVRRSARYRQALAEIRRANPVCDACVCPKRRGGGVTDRLRALGAAFGWGA
jgi:MoaA/NifB/PqqE/SkfB family radical SAM enzyme